MKHHENESSMYLGRIVTSSHIQITGNSITTYFKQFEKFHDIHVTILILAENLKLF